MAEWIEQLASRSISTSNGRAQAVVKWHADGYPNLKAINAVFGTEVSSVLVPKVGDVHPDFTGLVLKDLDVSPVSGFNDLWEVTFKYEQQSAFFGGLAPPPGTLPNQLGYVELSSEIRAEFQLVWRSGDVNIPSKGEPGTDGTADGPDDEEADIGGERIDANGNPVSAIRRIHELTLTETVNSPAFGDYGRYRFTRNQRIFYDAAPGRVLYRGASVRRTGVNVYQVSHSFVDDEFFHLQQQPYLNDSGKPFRRQDDKKAKLVYWVQPFSDLLDHNLISSNF